MQDFPANKPNFKHKVQQREQKNDSKLTPEEVFLDIAQNRQAEPEIREHKQSEVKRKKKKKTTRLKFNKN